MWRRYHFTAYVPASIPVIMSVLQASKIFVSTPRAILAVRAASTTASPIRSSSSAVPLANVEAQWSSLSPDEQGEVHRELEELQKRDWKTLSIDEKKAGEFAVDSLTSQVILLVWDRAHHFMRELTYYLCSLLCCLWASWTSLACYSSWSNHEGHHRNPRTGWRRYCCLRDNQVLWCCIYARPSPHIYL